MDGTLRFWWRVAAAAVAAVAGLGLGLQETGAWSPPRELTVSLVVAGVLVAFVTATEAAIDQRRRGRAAELREQARAVLSPLLLELEEATGINARQLGVAAYRISTPPWPLGKPRLERMLRLQLLIRVSSGIAWRPGVGVIGQCVQRGEDVVENLAALDEQLADVPRHDWASLGDDLTYGFSYEQFQGVRGKYGVVLASPMIKEAPLGSRVIGCVSVDAPADAFERLADEEVRGLVAAAAVTLAAIVSGEA
ncbi:MAG: hypothetical protein ACRDWI_11570 [Jiangellaceae bacterium]